MRSRQLAVPETAAAPIPSGPPEDDPPDPEDAAQPAASMADAKQNEGRRDSDRNVFTMASAIRCAPRSGADPATLRSYAPKVK